jgi:hypothetical protein
MTTKTKRTERPRLAELDRLDQAIAAVTERERQTRERARAEAERVPKLRAEAADAWSRGDEPTAARIEEEIAELDSELRGRWQPRMVACERGLAQARNLRTSFLHDNGDELVAEAKPDAEVARDRLVRAIEHLVEAAGSYGRESSRQSLLSGDPGQLRYRSVNTDHVTQVIAKVEALLTDNAIPVPAPVEVEPVQELPEPQPAAHAIEP